MHKKALLAVSFGTSHLDTLEKTIAAIERALAEAFPERTLRRAFTSGMILRRLDREGVHMDDVPAALEKLAEEGYTDVLIQPTHVINGAEYDKLTEQAAPFRSRFDRLVMGRPLLTREDDYKEVVRAMMDDLPQAEENTAILYMGHGTEHFANSAYAMLEYVFHEAGRDDVFIGTVEGYPGFDQALSRIRARKVTAVELRSLMIVAGDHAKNDLAGPEEDSWRCRLEREGYAVRCVLRGMGELPGIQAMYVGHAREAEQTE